MSRPSEVKASPANPLDVLVDADRLSSLSTTAIYELLQAGTLEARKSGRRTLVLMDGVIRHVQSLPKATFGVGTKA